jgi:3-hydroxyacyl-[acyl-carrier-protein] dehydratase
VLLNDFYTTSDFEQTGGDITCRIMFNAGHAIFGGHFPDHPVVPGVCMMEIVKEMLQQQLGKPLMLSTAGNVKFLQLITPDVQPTIHINWKETEQGYQVNASFKSGTTTLFKLDGLYIVM